jgi:hypothetical protein
LIGSPRFCARAPASDACPRGATSCGAGAGDRWGPTTPGLRCGRRRLPIPLNGLEQRLEERIRNDEITATLRLRHKISATGTNDFTITTQPTTTIGALTGTSAFVVRFNPSAAGARNATVTVASDDASEETYTFAITGTGLEAGEIGVKGNSTDIASGDTTPSTADYTLFGTAGMDTDQAEKDVEHSRQILKQQNPWDQKKQTEEHRKTLDAARKQAGGIDDEMRALWRRYGRPGVGVPEDGVDRSSSETRCEWVTYGEVT